MKPNHQNQTIETKPSICVGVGVVVGVVVVVQHTMQW
jgi:preprotein translocase subunit Sec61beta